MEQLKDNRSANILIVDDDIYTCEMYAMTLRAAGYHVDYVNDGASGYNLMNNKPYDVVLLDIMLPQLSGQDVLNKWRQSSPKGSKPPIIILTNYEQDDAARLDLVNKSDGYIIKASVAPRKLRQIIAKAIDI